MEIWGKSKEQDKVTTLDEHINDVLNVFYSLQHNLKSERIKELIKIVIKFHDLGKILPYFQIKSLKNKSYSPFDVYADIPHSLLSALLVNIESLKQEISSILIKEEDIDTYLHFILSAIAYHHWRESFYDIIEGNTYTFESLAELFSNENKRKAIEENLKSISEKIGLSDKSVSINNLWLNGLINGIKYADYITPPYQLYRMPKRIETENNKLKDWVLISGFTMLSDHYASFLEKEFSKNKKDSEIKNADIKPFDFKRIKENISLRLKEILKDKFEENNIWQFNSVQKYFGKNTILLAPTGMGKTEFAFLWTAGKKFFYTLPLRAAVNQIYKRTETICGEDKSGILHSDADVFIYGDGGESESMKIYDFSRQLSMAANVSTGDQFFPYALRPPGYEKIFAKFSYSNLIIDEVQAYDPKAAAIVVKFIEHIVQMGGKFLLMTATLPAFIKDEITNRIGSFQTLDLFQETKKLQTFSKHKLNILTDDYTDGKLSYSEHIIKQIVETAKSNNGQRVLVVLNTIKQAQKVYSDILDAVKTENVSIKLFHSRYSYKHRQKIENDLQNFIGNNDDSRNTKKPKILVATQVVEASLDLDADYLFTELAPWDSLIQRMGRVFRELRPDTQNSNKLIRKRYKEDNIPDNIFILIYNGKNKKGKEVLESGNGWVYNEELLRGTLKLLETQNKTISTEKLSKYVTASQQINLKNIIKTYNKSSFVIDEKKKNELVNQLFDSLDKEKSKYLLSFYKMLEILDAGFMSDRKADAQHIFREINDVAIVPATRKAEIFEEIKNFDFDMDRAFTRFKKDIISKFVVNVQRYKVEVYLTEFNIVARQLELNEEVKEYDIIRSNINRIKKWMWGIYFAEVDYSETEGLTGISDSNKNFEFL